MAEILCKVGDNPDCGTKARWHDGDVVAVQHDNFHWGRIERDPVKFRIVRLLGVNPDKIRFLVTDWPDPGFKRRWCVDAVAEVFVDRKTGATLPWEALNGLNR